MHRPNVSRRELLIQSSATLALLHAPWLAQAFPSRPGEEVVPWLDQPGANPSGGVVENLQPWENLASSFITPNDKFFRVSHYDKPVIDEKKWNLEVAGLCEEADDSDASRSQSTAAAGGCLYDRMLWKSWVSFFHRWHRQRPVGGYTASPRSLKKQEILDRTRHRGGLLGYRCRGRDRYPRRQVQTELCPQHVGRGCHELRTISSATR